tara:strand:+ start:690 stop:2372 length:1683 start_codon:yes stop_codon:yes gene_type:complete
MSINALERYFAYDSILLGFKRTEVWTEKECKDYMGLHFFGMNLEENCQRLSEKIIDGDYKPVRPPKFTMPKKTGMQRVKTRLHIEDAIVYQTIANQVAVSAYDDLVKNSDFSFGSVLSLQVKRGKEILGELEPSYFFYKWWPPLYKKFKDSVEDTVNEDPEITHRLETDITGFFDSITHYSLLELIEKKYRVESEILDFFAICLNTWSGPEEGPTIGVGIPQGPAPSHFFANLILNDLDEYLISKEYNYYRYVDDMRMYGYSEIELRRALIEIDTYLKRFALSLNAKKTAIEKLDRKPGEKVTIIDFRDPSPVADEEYSEDVDEFFDKGLEQHGEDLELDGKSIIDDVDQITDFCRMELENVESDLRKAISSDANIPYIKKEFQERDRYFLHIAYRFRKVLSLAKEWSVNADSYNIEKCKLLWFVLFDQFFWRANNWCWVLSMYQNDKQVKNGLLDRIEQYKEYTWIKHHIYSALQVQTLSGREIRNLFEQFDESGSWFDRLSLYKLLIVKSEKKPQLRRSILKKAEQEKHYYLRKMLGYWVQNNELIELNTEELTSFMQ